jgi:hypothetical protein
MAGSDLVIAGIRVFAGSRLRWIDSGDMKLEPGDQILVNGDRATVVVAPGQLRGALDAEAVSLVAMTQADPAIHVTSEPESAKLDRIVDSFPRPGSTWSDEVGSGIVEAINVKNGTFDVRSSLTGDSVTIQHLARREQAGHGNVSRRSHTQDN